MGLDGQGVIEGRPGRDQGGRSRREAFRLALGLTPMQGERAERASDCRNILEDGQVMGVLGHSCPGRRSSLAERDALAASAVLSLS